MFYNIFTSGHVYHKLNAITHENEYMCLIGSFLPFSECYEVTDRGPKPHLPPNLSFYNVSENGSSCGGSSLRMEVR